MDDKEQQPNPQQLEGDGLGDAPSQSEATAQGQTGLHPELEQAEAQIAELSNRLLRAQAEFENYRRRVQKEKEELAVFANQKLILGLLPVLDNLDRALSTQAAAGDEKLRQGVELTARSFRDILGREGVTPVDAVGQPFDPNLHEAIMTVESPDHADGVVVSELQKGYKLGERVIRPSMVQVNKQS